MLTGLGNPLVMAMDCFDGAAALFVLLGGDLNFHTLVSCAAAAAAAAAAVVDDRLVETRLLNAASACTRRFARVPCAPAVFFSTGVFATGAVCSRLVW